MDGKVSELWSAQARIWTQSAEMQSASDIHYTAHTIETALLIHFIIWTGVLYRELKHL